ncbi:MAG: hypothetical protein A2X52_10135 [Candidatus Rokubacteria bacterium GWC2_70_16]|nr:MAG: hypothetical protein A2X52_10135 [Candidatus Rokubacteria bacterium GWC2_70_16]
MTGVPDLVREAVEAHGGLARWQAVREIRARCRSGGFALASRLQPRAFRQYEVRVSTAEPRAVVVPFPRPGRRGVFAGDTVRIESDAGLMLAERPHARAAFARFRRKLWWDRLDALHFGGYALWNYFCAPFLFLSPGFDFAELPPWEEEGERWRRLRVVFPPGVPTHCREQVYYFDATGLIRRLDYTAEVFGRWARAAHYCHDHREAGGIVVPRRRRVLPRAPSGRPRWGPTLVWIAVDDVAPVLDTPATPR